MRRFVSIYLTVISYRTMVHNNMQITIQICLHAIKYYKEQHSETSIWDVKPFKSCKIMFSEHIAHQQ